MSFAARRRARTARTAATTSNLGRAAYQVLALIAPYLVGDARALIERLGQRLPLTRAGDAMAKKWAKFPHPDKAYAYDAAGLKKHWARLHKGDCEPLPKDADVLEAWRAFPRRRVRRRRSRRAPRAGGAGINAAVKAQIDLRQLSREVGQGEARAARGSRAAGPTSAARAAPKDANAHYLYAFALGRYSQGISVAKALAQGFGGKIKDALLTALKLEPKHADAHIAYGSYQAEVIDKVGGLVAGMTYGAKKDSALEHYEKALKLYPGVARSRTSSTRNGLIMLFGKGRIAEATKLYEKAAALQARRTRWSGSTSSSRKSELE